MVCKCYQRPTHHSPITHLSPFNNILNILCVNAKNRSEISLKNPTQKEGLHSTQYPVLSHFQTCPHPCSTQHPRCHAIALSRAD